MHYCMCCDRPVIKLVDVYWFLGRQSKKELLDIHTAQKNLFKAIRTIAKDRELREVFTLLKIIIISFQTEIIIMNNFSMMKLNLMGPLFTHCVFIRPLFSPCSIIIKPWLRWRSNRTIIPGPSGMQCSSAEQFILP